MASINVKTTNEFELTINGHVHVVQNLEQLNKILSNIPEYAMVQALQNYYAGV